MKKTMSNEYKSSSTRIIPIISQSCDLKIEAKNEISKRTFYVITGEGFSDYANYKVLLNAELYRAVENTEQNMYSKSDAGDYIIYTNAKIIPEFVIID